MRPVLVLFAALALLQSGCAISSFGAARTGEVVRSHRDPSKISITEGSAARPYLEIGTGVVLHDVDVETGPDSDREQDIREVRTMAKELASEWGGTAIIDFELSRFGAIFTVIRR